MSSAKTKAQAEQNQAKENLLNRLKVGIDSTIASLNTDQIVFFEDEINRAQKLYDFLKENINKGSANEFEFSIDIELILLCQISWPILGLGFCV